MAAKRALHHDWVREASLYVEMLEDRRVLSHGVLTSQSLLSIVQEFRAETADIVESRHSSAQDIVYSSSKYTEPPSLDRDDSPAKSQRPSNGTVDWESTDFQWKTVKDYIAKTFLDRYQDNSTSSSESQTKLPNLTTTNAPSESNDTPRTEEASRNPVQTVVAVTTTPEPILNQQPVEETARHPASEAVAEPQRSETTVAIVDSPISSTFNLTARREAAPLQRTTVARVQTVERAVETREPSRPERTEQTASQAETIPVDVGESVQATTEQVVEVRAEVRVALVPGQSFRLPTNANFAPHTTMMLTANPRLADLVQLGTTTQPLNHSSDTERGAESSRTQPVTTISAATTTWTAPQDITDDLDYLAPQSTGLLTTFAPFDPAELKVAVRQLVGQVEDLGAQLASWFAQGDISSYAFAAAAVAGFYELRRRRQRSAQTEADEDVGSSLPTSFWVPCLTGGEVDS